MKAKYQWRSMYGTYIVDCQILQIDDTQKNNYLIKFYYFVDEYETRWVAEDCLEQIR